MGIHYTQTSIHWNYFLAIENDFEKISRYVEFTEDNNATYSIEFARIIMASTQEIDGIMKKICNLLSPHSESNNINEYKAIIKVHFSEFISEEVYLTRFGMSSRPWINWLQDENDNNPDWWKANNKIKHDRTENFEKANLKHAFNAVGGLLIATLYYYKLYHERENNKDITWKDLTRSLRPTSSLFSLAGDYYNGEVLVGELQW